MDIVDPATHVVVATLRPLEEFHATTGERTACGQPTHGWYPMAAGMAYNNVCSPCPRCFPPDRMTNPGLSGPGW